MCFLITGLAPSNFTALSSAIPSLYSLSASGLLVLTTPGVNKKSSTSPSSADWSHHFIKPFSNFTRTYSVAINPDLHSALSNSSLYDSNLAPSTLNIFTEGSKSPDHCANSPYQLIVERRNHPKVCFKKSPEKCSSGEVLLRKAAIHCEVPRKLLKLLAAVKHAHLFLSDER